MAWRGLQWVITDRSSQTVQANQPLFSSEMKNSMTWVKLRSNTLKKSFKMARPGFGKMFKPRQDSMSWLTTCPTWPLTTFSSFWTWFTSKLMTTGYWSGGGVHVAWLQQVDPSWPRLLWQPIWYPSRVLATTVLELLSKLSLSTAGRDENAFGKRRMGFVSCQELIQNTAFSGELSEEALTSKIWHLSF